MITESMVRTMLMDVFDPEMGINIIDLGLVYKIEIADNKIKIEMTLTSPGCPIGPELISDVKRILKGINGIKEVEVNLVWYPPWSPDMMTEDAKDQLSDFYPIY